jgi:hypothetical protein
LSSHCRTCASRRRFRVTAAPSHTSSVRLGELEAAAGMSAADSLSCKTALKATVSGRGLICTRRRQTEWRRGGRGPSDVVEAFPTSRSRPEGLEPCSTNRSSISPGHSRRNCLGNGIGGDACGTPKDIARWGTASTQLRISSAKADPRSQPPTPMICGRPYRARCRSCHHVPDLTQWPGSFREIPAEGLCASVSCSARRSGACMVSCRMAHELR